MNAAEPAGTATPSLGRELMFATRYYLGGWRGLPCSPPSSGGLVSSWSWLVPPASPRSSSPWRRASPCAGWACACDGPAQPRHPEERIGGGKLPTSAAPGEVSGILKRPTTDRGPGA